MNVAILLKCACVFYLDNIHVHYIKLIKFSTLSLMININFMQQKLHGVQYLQMSKGQVFLVHA